jgi:hypothetical protein
MIISSKETVVCFSFIHGILIVLSNTQKCHSRDFSIVVQMIRNKLNIFYCIVFDILSYNYSNDSINIMTLSNWTRLNSRLRISRKKPYLFIHEGLYVSIFFILQIDQISSNDSNGKKRTILKSSITNTESKSIFLNHFCHWIKTLTYFSSILYENKRQYLNKPLSNKKNLVCDSHN